MGTRIAMVAALLAVILDGRSAAPHPEAPFEGAISRQGRTVMERRGPEVVVTDAEGNQVVRRDGWAWVETGTRRHALRIDVHTVRVLVPHGPRR